VATDAAFFNALLVTNKGSIIPFLIILTILPVTTSIPTPSLPETLNSTPELLNIFLNGALMASSSISSPMFLGFTFVDASNKAIPIFRFNFCRCI